MSLNVYDALIVAAVAAVFALIALMAAIFFGG